MLSFVGFLFALMLVMWLAPESPAGRLLLRALVVAPMERLARLRRHDLLYFVILSGLMLGAGEMVALFGSEFIAAYALDLAIYFDAVIVTYALSALAQIRGSASCFRGVVRKVFKRGGVGNRRASRPAVRREHPPANDDEAHHWAVAA